MAAKQHIIIQRSWACLSEFSLHSIVHYTFTTTGNYRT